jgi:hypothetical protein
VSVVEEQLTIVESPKASNLVARYWRGEYSLGISYWVFGIGINVVLVINLILLALLAFKLGANEQQALLTTLPTSAVLLVWYSVGLWSSANSHVARTGRSGWATAARVMLVIGWINLIGELVGALHNSR